MDTTETSEVEGSEGGQAVGLTVGQAAKAAGLSARTVRRAAREGALAASEVGGPRGREWRILPQDLEAWVRERAGKAARGTDGDLLPDGQTRPVESGTLSRAALAGIAAAAGRVDELSKRLDGEEAERREGVRRLEAQIAELRAELSDARRPWWRRLLGRGG